MKKNLLFLLLVMASTVSRAQWDWHNPLEVKGTNKSFVWNQGWNEDGGNYCRLPLRAKQQVRQAVWNLACQSAGLMLRFKTDATDIKVQYQVTGGFSMPHMPATGVSGLDLYRLTPKGEKEFCFGGYSFADTVRYAYQVDKAKTLPDGMNEFILYLPLYNGVKWLEIGVKKDSKFSFVPVSAQKPIVLYGTSIAQGACASRPGMAWGNILARSLDRPLVNLGFSGNGKLEKGVLDFINEQDACLYILDCMANLSNYKAEELKVLVKDAVRQIRSKHSTPILLVEHAGYSNGLTYEKRYEAYEEPNRGQKMAYEELQAEGVKNLFYLSNKELNYHPDSWVDYVHPSDWGMVQQAVAVEKKVRKILK